METAARRLKLLIALSMKLGEVHVRNGVVTLNFPKGH